MLFSKLSGVDVVLEDRRQGLALHEPIHGGIASLATQSVRDFGSTRMPRALRMPSRRGVTNSETFPLRVDPHDLAVSDARDEEGLAHRIVGDALGNEALLGDHEGARRARGDGLLAQSRHLRHDLLVARGAADRLEIGVGVDLCDDPVSCEFLERAHGGLGLAVASQCAGQVVHDPDVTRAKLRGLAGVGQESLHVTGLVALPRQLQILAGGARCLRRRRGKRQPDGGRQRQEHRHVRFSHRPLRIGGPRV